MGEFNILSKYLKCDFPQRIFNIRMHMMNGALVGQRRYNKTMVRLWCEHQAESRIDARFLVKVDSAFQWYILNYLITTMFMLII